MAEQGMTITANSVMQKLQSTNLKKSAEKSELTEKEKISAFIHDDKIDELAVLKAYKAGQLSDEELNELGFQIVEFPEHGINVDTSGTWYSPIVTPACSATAFGTVGAALGAFVGLFTHEGPRFGAAYLGTLCGIFGGALGLLKELGGSPTFVKNEVSFETKTEKAIKTPSGDVISLRRLEEYL